MTIFEMAIGQMEPQYFEADSEEGAILAALLEAGVEVRESGTTHEYHEYWSSGEWKALRCYPESIQATDLKQVPDRA